MSKERKREKREKRDFGNFFREDREERKRNKVDFKGNFSDYLNFLQECSDEEIERHTQLAHSRLYRVITDPGVRELSPDEDPKLRRLYGNQKVKKYAFFEKDFFGMEPVIAKIARFFHSAAMRGEECRQVLLFIGPVGAGKSSLVEKLKNGLKNAPAFFALKNCPMHEDPLHLVPEHLRDECKEVLGVTIEGDLCPVCRFKLREEFDGEYEKFPVEMVEFSKRNRRGIGVVPPVDPNNQDTSVLIGSEDISKLDIYPENDPRTLSLNGAFNSGNRGLVEFIEVFKNEIEFLHTMITATQEKSIPAPGKHSMIYFDGAIVVHSNEAEWNKFKADHTNEAILDRVVKIDVPYVLRKSEEVKIYRKILDQSNFKAHIAPHTLEMIAMFAVLSRLAGTSKCDLMTKSKIYDGEEVIEKGQTKKVDITELREEVPSEGMSGISTRFGMKCLDNALSDSEFDCVNPIAVREQMIKKVKSDYPADDTRKRYLGLLQEEIHKEYLKILEKEISKAFVHAYNEQAETLFQNYLDNAEAFTTKKKMKDKNTGEELEPDIKFMVSIEEQLGLTGSAAEGFRQDVTSFLFSLVRKGEKINYQSYEPLKEAIEKKLMASVKDLSRIITKAKTRDKEQGEKYDVMVKTMVDENGYCPHCCETVLRYAANHLWRD